MKEVLIPFICGFILGLPFLIEGIKIGVKTRRNRK
jgi:hypothetical protein